MGAVTWRCHNAIAAFVACLAVVACSGTANDVASPQTSGIRVPSAPALAPPSGGESGPVIMPAEPDQTPAETPQAQASAPLPDTSTAWSLPTRSALDDLRGQVLYEEYEHLSHTYHVVVIGIDGAGYRRLAEGTWARLAPDGRTFAYVAPDASIVVRNVDGSDPMTLATPPCCSRSSAPAWSPDGRSLVYAVDCIGLACALDGESGLWSVDVDGSPPNRLVGGAARDPAWSRDGMLLAWAAGSRLMTMAAGGSNVRSVHDAGDGEVAAPSFSPDGRDLAFQVIHGDVRGEKPTSMHVRIVGVDGSRERLLWRDGPWAPTRSPQWSPNGALVTFADAATAVVARPDGSRSWTIGTTNHDATDRDDIYSSDPSWSPDGEWIILGAVEQSFNRLRRLYVVRPDGSQLTEIPNALLGESPQWW